MGSPVVVPYQPIIQVVLQFLHSQINLPSESNVIKLVENGLVEPLTDVVCLWVLALVLEWLILLKARKSS
jgi:hypothetical protein